MHANTLISVFLEIIKDVLLIFTCRSQKQGYPRNFQFLPESNIWFYDCAVHYLK